MAPRAQSASRSTASRKTPAKGKRAAPRKAPTRPGRAPEPAAFYVCRSCVWSEDRRERDGKRQGTFLLEAVQARIAAEPLPEALSLRGVYCLNGCKSPCNVAFRAAGKHHLRFSRLTPANARDVLAFARAYQASPTGLLPEEETPEGMRGKTTVCIPPIG